MKTKIVNLIILASAILLISPIGYSETSSDKSGIEAKDQNLKILIKGNDFKKPVQLEFMILPESRFMEISGRLIVDVSLSKIKDGKFRIEYHYQNVEIKEDSGKQTEVNHQLSGVFIAQIDKEIEFMKSDSSNLSVLLSKE